MRERVPGRYRKRRTRAFARDAYRIKAKPYSAVPRSMASHGLFAACSFGAAFSFGAGL